MGRLSVYVLLAAALLAASPAPASDARAEPRGFDRRALDWAFSRADRESDAERWRSLAEEGRRAAVAAWELDASCLYADKASFAAAREDAEAWSSSELESRRELWLTERFLASRAEAEAAAAARNGPDRAEPDFLASARAAFPELLDLAREDRREAFARLLEARASARSGALASGLDALYAQEERRRAAAEASDLDSLRRRSEGEAAAALAEAAARKAAQACAEGLADLDERVERARAGTGDLSIAGPDWLDRFEAQFDRGLEAWKAAEERFLSDRLEWEREASAGWESGAEVWSRALSSLTAERARWERRARSLLETGKSVFSAASADLEAQLSRAEASLSRDLSLRAGAGSERVRTWSDSAISSAEAADAAGRDAEIWLKRLGWKRGEDPAPGSVELNAWLEGKRLLHGGGASGADAEALSEAARCLALRVAYLSRAGEARDALERECGFSSEAAPGLDAGQAELRRLKALAAYWDRRTKRAALTASYAAALGSDREAEASSSREWESAKAAYDAALSSYSAACDALDSRGSVLESSRRVVDAAASALAEADASLAELENRTALILSAAALGDGAALDAEIADLSTRQAEASDAFSAQAVSVRSAWAAGSLADAASRCRAAAARALAAEARGNGSSLPLASLASALEAARNAEAGVPPEDREGALLLAAARRDAELALEARLDRIALLGASDAESWYSSRTGSAAAASGVAASLAADLDAARYGLLEARVRVELHALEAVLDPLSGAGADALSLAGTYCGEGAAELEAALVPFAAEIAAARSAGLGWAGFSAGFSGRDGVLAVFLSGSSPFVLPDGSAASRLFLGAEAAAEARCSARAEAYSSLAALAPGLELGRRQACLADFRAVLGALGLPGLDSSVPPEAAVAAALSSLDPQAAGAALQSLSDAAERFSVLAPEAVGNALRAWAASLVSSQACRLRGPGPAVSVSAPALRDALAEEESAEAAGFASWRAAQNASPPPAWREARLLDAEEVAASRAADLAAVLAAWTSAPSSLPPALASAAAALAADPWSDWTGAALEADDASLSYAARAGELALDGRRAEASSLRRELSRLADARSASAASAGNAELVRCGAALEAARTRSSNALAAFRTASSSFAAEGAAYDAACAEAERRRAGLESAADVYGARDDLRLWAGTSYLKGSGDSSGGYLDPEAALEFARGLQVRASQAVAALEAALAARPAGTEFSDAGLESLFGDYRARWADLERAAALEADFARVREDAEAERDARASALIEAAFGASSPFASAPVLEGEGASPWLACLEVDASGNASLCGAGAALAGALDGDRKSALDRYFSEGPSGTGAPFARQLGLWASRVAAYDWTGGRFKDWAFARDYLLSSIAAANPGIPGLDLPSDRDLWLHDSLGGYRVRGSTIAGMMDALRDGDIVANIVIYAKQSRGEATAVPELIGVETRKVRDGLPTLWKAAWDRLGSQERGDLEFLAFLERIGCVRQGPLLEALDAASALEEFEYVDSKVTSARRSASGFAGISFLDEEWRELRDLQKNYRPRLDEYRNRLASGARLLSGCARRIAEAEASFVQSEARLSLLDGDAAGALQASGILGSGGLPAFRALESRAASYSVPGPAGGGAAASLAALRSACAAALDSSRSALDLAWSRVDASASRSRTDGRAAFESFISGGPPADAASAAAAFSGPDSLGSYLSALAREAASHLSGPSAARACADLAALHGRAAAAAAADRSAASADDRDLRQADLAANVSARLSAADLVLRRGRADWESSLSRAAAEKARWEREYRAAYAAGREAWSLSALASVREKDAWARSAAACAARAGDDAALALVSGDAAAGARRVDLRRCSSLPSDSLADAGALAEAAVGRALSSAGVVRLDQAFASLSSAPAFSGVGFSAGAASSWNSASLRCSAAAWARDAAADLAARESRLVAASARESLRFALASLAERLAEANRGFAASMDQNFLDRGGWRRGAGVYEKDVIVYSTFLHPVVTSRASVAVYEDFVLDAWTPGADLESADLDSLGVFGARALTEKALGELRDRAESIFGASGSFKAYLGAAPALADDPDPDDAQDEIFKDRGSGELGRLLRTYLYWALQESRGVGEMSKPWYETAFWDDRDQWLKAPTVRGVVDVGVDAAIIAAGVVASPFSGGASFLGSVALAASLSMADDAVFTVADAQSGYRDWDEAGAAFGKKALLSAGSFALGGLAQGLGAGFSRTSLSGALGRSALSGGRVLAAGALGASSQALSWNGSGLAWDGDAFSSSFGSSVLAAAAAAGGSLVSSGLGALDRPGSMLGFSSAQIGNMQRLNDVVGAAAGQGFSYALGGEAVFNLATYGGAGFVELHLGREGLTMNLGGGGADLSPEALLASLSGAAAWREAARIAAFAGVSGDPLSAALRAQYGFGDAVQRAQLEDILDGRTSLSFGDARGGAALSVLGPEGKSVLIDASGMPASDADRLRLALVLGHEAYRDGVDSGPGQEAETAAAVAGHSALLGRLLADPASSSLAGLLLSDPRLGADYAAWAGSDADRFADYVSETYDSSADYWKVKKNGAVLDDGTGDIAFEDGRATIETGKGKLGGLAAWLGVTAVDAQRLLLASGFSKDASDFWSSPGSVLDSAALSALLASKGLDPAFVLGSGASRAGNSLMANIDTICGGSLAAFSVAPPSSTAFSVVPAYDYEGASAADALPVELAAAALPENPSATQVPDFSRLGINPVKLEPYADFDQIQWKTEAHKMLHLQKVSREAGNADGYCNATALIYGLMEAKGLDPKETLKILLANSDLIKGIDMESGYIDKYEAFGKSIGKILGISDLQFTVLAKDVSLDTLQAYLTKNYVQQKSAHSFIFSTMNYGVHFTYLGYDNAERNPWPVWTKWSTLKPIAYRANKWSWK